MRYLLTFLLIFSLCFAQKAEVSERMTQDMHVMNEILHELFNSSFEVSDMLFRLENTPPRYQKGFGMVLYAPPTNKTLRISSRSNRFPKSQDLMIEPQAQQVQADSLEKQIVKTARFFLKQYGDLAGELREDEKIMVVYDRSSRSMDLTFYRGKVRFPTSGETYTGNISVSVAVGAIRDLQEGNISEAAFHEKVEVHSEQKEAINQLEYKVFGKILSEQLFEVEKAHRETFVLEKEGSYFSFPASKVDMKLLQGLGVTYVVYWGGKYGNAFTLTSRSQKRGKEQSRYQLILDDEGKQQAQDDTDALVEKFGEEIPKIIFAYGRTLRGLEDKELLTIEVMVPDCPNCTEKSVVAFSVKGSVLRAYDRGDISLDNAKKAIQMNRKKAE